MDLFEREIRLWNRDHKANNRGIPSNIMQTAR